MITKHKYLRPTTDVLFVKLGHPMLTTSYITFNSNVETDEDDIQYSRKNYYIWDEEDDEDEE